MLFIRTGTQPDARASKSRRVVIMSPCGEKQSADSPIAREVAA